jgi:hypothetical protein
MPKAIWYHLVNGSAILTALHQQMGSTSAISRAPTYRRYNPWNGNSLIATHD